MKHMTQVILGIAFVGAGLIATSGAAVAQDDEADESLEEITVIATRREERAVDVPVSLSVFDATSAAQKGITDINSIADFIPNLQATDGGSPSIGNLVIRGIYAGGAPTVGTYIDDVPYGGVVGSFASSLALDASLYDLDSIEIVRGPQGTLFGASSVGGVVRYRVKQPSLTDLDGYLSVDYSDTDSGSNNMLIRGRVSAPLVEDKFAIVVSGYAEDNGGFIDSGVTGESDIDEHDFWGGRIGALWAVTDNFDLELSAMRHEADFESASYESFDPSTGQPIFGPLQTEFAAPRDIEFDQYALTANIDLEIGTLTSVTSDQSLKLNNLTDVTPILGPLLPPGTTVLLSSGNDSSRFTQELRLTSNADDGIEWIIGAYYTKQESDEFQITIEDPPDINLITLNTALEYTELALFGNVTFDLSEQWDVTVGLRYSDNENDITNLFSGALSNPLLNDLRTVTDDTVTTWLFNTRYRINDAVNFYGRAASGYRPGGANLVVELGGQVFGSPSYTNDDLWSYEAGIKGRIGSSGIYYDLGVYVIDWQDAHIQFVNPVTGLTETGNAEGDVEAKGVEASLSGEVFSNFMVTAALAISDTELKQDEPNLGGVAGEALPGNPDSTFSLTGDYTVPLANSNLNLGASWRYVGDYNSNFSLAPTGNYDNSAYSHFDVRAGVSWDRFAVNLYGTNVTNERDYQTVFPVAPNFAYGVPLRPRTIGLNLRYDF